MPTAVGAATGRPSPPSPQVAGTRVVYSNESNVATPEAGSLASIDRGRKKRTGETRSTAGLNGHYWPGDPNVPNRQPDGADQDAARCGDEQEPAGVTAAHSLALVYPFGPPK